MSACARRISSLEHEQIRDLQRALIMLTIHFACGFIRSGNFVHCFAQ
jgi:hypothetical protein